MGSITLCVALLAVSASNDAVLLHFTAPWCGPCQSMSPTMSQLAADGYPIRKVDFDTERDLARQFQVDKIPSFVVVRGGKEVARIVGPASATELRDLFAKANTPKVTLVNGVRGQSPEEPLRRISPNSAGHQRLLNESGSPPRTMLLGETNSSARTMPVSNPAPDAGNPFRNARARDDFRASPEHAGGAVSSSSGRGANDLIKYAARLKIEDASGSSYGTGTIIDVRGDQALILTCGHIFRDSQGKGEISVDLFVSGAQAKLPGRLVVYNEGRDIGLVSVKPGIPVTAARIAPEGYRANSGDPVVTVGCDHGQDPTAIESQVIAVDKFGGPSNVQVAGQPVQGRSGGGLFTPDGMVIGVCNAADPTDNAGLYAAATVVHQELDAARLTSVYRGAPSGANATSIARSEPNPPRSEALEMVNEVSAPLSSNERTTLATLQNRQDAEVICIVRPRGNVGAKSEVIVLDRASSVFLDQLDAEREMQISRRLTSHEVPRSQESWRKSR
jgi:thiol-disulfide isomerase/thioredoxin